MAIKLKPLHPMPYGHKRTALIECIEREIRMRNLVYPKRVSGKKMTKLTAERELGMMEQVLDAVKLAIMFDNADLCVAAVLIELRKYQQMDDFLKMFSNDEMSTIQKNLALHIRENIFEVKEITAELGLNNIEEDDVGL